MPELNLTRLQAFYFFLIIVSIPLQYFLVEWTGSNKFSRVEFENDVQTVKRFFSSWFSWSYWKNVINLLLKTKTVHQSKKNSAIFLNQKPLRIYHECVAKEVLEYRDPNGYFASSSAVRSSRSFIKYRVGQVIRHKKWGYRAVIVGWDSKCQAPQHWVDRNHRGHPEYRHQPNYALLVDSRDRYEVQTTYVPEENIEIILNTKIKHPEINHYFDFYDGAQYHMRPALKQMYPYD